jgi:hypothetical protein
MTDAKHLIEAGHKAISAISHCMMKHSDDGYSESEAEDARKKSAEAAHTYSEAVLKYAEADADAEADDSEADTAGGDTVETADSAKKATSVITKVTQAVSRLLTMPQANKAISELNTDKENLLRQLSDLQGQVEQAQNFVHTATTEKEKLNKDFAVKETDYQNKLTALQKELEETKQSVSNKVVTELASVGIQQGTIKEELSPSLTPKEVLETFEAMKAGPERTAYYKANDKLIIQGDRERRNINK